MEIRNVMEKKGMESHEYLFKMVFLNDQIFHPQ